MKESSDDGAYFPLLSPIGLKKEREERERQQTWKNNVKRVGEKELNGFTILSFPSLLLEDPSQFESKSREEDGRVEE